MNKLGQQARQAGREMSRADSAKKNLALLKIADALAKNKDELVAENQKDLGAFRADLRYKSQPTER